MKDVCELEENFKIILEFVSDCDSFRSSFVICLASKVTRPQGSAAGHLARSFILLEDGLLLPWQWLEVRVVMNKEAPLLERASRKGARPHRRLRAAHWSIGTSICLNADVRRIFQLLTVPEYLEAWLRLPGDEADASVEASRQENDYRLEFYSAGALKTSVSGSFLVCRQRKMLFTWLNLGVSPGFSMVDVRLRGNFGGSILELRHSGLASAAEYFWQMSMWRASFERLVDLVKNSPVLSN
jgi:hypothetical protein